MKKIVLFFFLLNAHYCFGQQQFQLATPLMKYKSMFFSDSTSFIIIFNEAGATVRYTLNGNEPTENDFLYTKAVTITKRTLVKIKAFSNIFLASETVTAEFINDGKKIEQIEFSKPNETYATTNAAILNDNIGGNTNFKSGTWLGYDTDTVFITIKLKQQESIRSLLVNILQDENSWIFLPEQILVYYYDDNKKSFLPIGKETFSSESLSPKQCSIREISLSQKIETHKLKLILLPVKKIPDWHIGKGKHAWLFIDEIKVY